MNLLTIARRTLALLGLSLALSAHAADASAPDTLIRQLSIETNQNKTKEKNEPARHVNVQDTLQSSSKD
jgi:phospholipid transport system substrate-binding protein